MSQWNILLHWCAKLNSLSTRHFTSRLKCDLKSWRKLLKLLSIRYWPWQQNSLWSIWVWQTSTHRNVTKQIRWNLPTITQSIWNKTSLLVATVSEHALARLQRAMIVSLSVIAPQNNVAYIILSQDAKSSLRLQCEIAGVEVSLAL